MGLPILVVLVPVVLGVAESAASFGREQWLLYLFWLIVIGGEAVSFSRVKNESVWDKALLFICSICLIGVFVCWFCRVWESLYICVLLSGWAFVIHGFSDFYRKKQRCRAMWFCLYFSAGCFMLYLSCWGIGFAEWLFVELFILQTVFACCFVIAAVYNGIEWLWRRSVSKKWLRKQNAREEASDEAADTKKEF